MDFSWKSAILHAIYACVSAAMPVACTVGFLKTVQPNSFSKLIPDAFNFKNNAQETFCLSQISDFVIYM